MNVWEEKVCCSNIDCYFFLFRVRLVFVCAPDTLYNKKFVLEETKKIKGKEKCDESKMEINSFAFSFWEAVE